MSVAYEDIVRGAYQLLGRPSQLDLPYKDVLEHARDVIRGRLLDLKMSARGHTNVTGPFVAPTAQTMEVAPFIGENTTYFIPVKVEWRTLADIQTVHPRKAEVVAFEQLGELFRSSQAFDETYVAFTDNFSKITFSEPLDALDKREYRIVYEDLSDVTAGLEETVNELPDLFIVLCKYETAVMCLDHVTNETNDWMEKRERLRSSLLGRFAMEEQRFTKWRNTLFGNKKIKRLGFRTRTR